MATVVLGVLLSIVLAVMAAGLYVAVYFRWYFRCTRGTAYFGKPLAERRAIKEAIRRRSRTAVRLMTLLSRITRDGFVLVARYHGITAPRFKCSRDTLRKAFRYDFEARDIVVATQMKCGTTWMQQLVYEIISHGNGDLSDAGHVHLYALSPWLESFDSVSIEDAPRIGARGARLIKTHLPAESCRYSSEPKYIYVTRHPVSCFASCLDFSRLLGGPLSPSSRHLADLFCSDRMWWGSWPRHVLGWWQRAQRYPNVLFVHFEEMREDLRTVAARVATFLEEELTEEEFGEVVRKSGFAYMKEHEECFDMSPPTMFSVSGEFLKSGKADRHRDAGESERERIMAFCRRELAGSEYPTARYYPDLAVE
jgi:aryl sulfotransferase